MADWDTVAQGLLRTACSVDADVQFRLLALKTQCEGLEALCRYIRSLETSLVREKTAQQSETLAVQQSIQDAIQRARRVREELATTRQEEEEVDPQEERLQSILQAAKATRAAQSRDKVEEIEPPPKLRLEYPRKLKALEAQLLELQLKEDEASMRLAFCCKMSEYLSLNSKRKQLILQPQKAGAVDRTDVPVARIQTSYSKQVARLRGGYQRLMEFVLQKVVESPTFQQTVDAPSFSTVFPIFHRLKQAKKMLRLLNSETSALFERLPASPPKLAPGTVSHRDAMLARIRRKKPQPAVGVIDNEALQTAALKTRSYLHDNGELMDKLQAAWATDEESSDPIDVYSTTAREIVLTELSNAVLWSFKTHFADNVDPPNTSQLQAVMRLIRLVDSVALSRGRVYRSVVTPS